MVMDAQERKEYMKAYQHKHRERLNHYNNIYNRVNKLQLRIKRKQLQGLLFEDELSKEDERNDVLAYMFEYHNNRPKNIDIDTIEEYIFKN